MFRTLLALLALAVFGGGGCEAPAPKGQAAKGSAYATVAQSAAAALKAALPGASAPKLVFRGNEKSVILDRIPSFQEVHQKYGVDSFDHGVLYTSRDEEAEAGNVVRLAVYDPALNPGVRDNDAFDALVRAAGYRPASYNELLTAASLGVTAQFSIFDRLGAFGTTATFHEDLHFPAAENHSWAKMSKIRLATLQDPDERYNHLQLLAKDLDEQQTAMR